MPFHRQNETNKAVRYGNIFIFCSHYYRYQSKAVCRVVDLPARSFDLAHPGVAPSLVITERNSKLRMFVLDSI